MAVYSAARSLHWWTSITEIPQALRYSLM